jgi:7-cyano-7-deazaguanine synthase
MKRAIVLLSGGLDSAVALAISQSEGFSVSVLSFDYGQRHRAELSAARRIASGAGIQDHFVVQLDLRAFGNSALTDEIAIPIDRTVEQMNAEIPLTYVPARNTIFLSYALAFAEVRSASDIFIGVNALDYSGYPDCRPEYIHAFEKMARLATSRSVGQGEPLHLRAPLIQKSKTEIIRLGAELGVDFSKTVSCYQAGDQGEACGRCDACLLRRKAFIESGIPDPTRYVESARVPK